MVNAVRSTVNILGCHGKSKSVKRIRFFVILVGKDIKAGDSLSQENLRIARPGDGLCPSRGGSPGKSNQESTRGTSFKIG